MTEWDAAGYFRMSGLQQAMAEEVLALLPLARARRVLDVGCGDGKLSARIAHEAPRAELIGVDRSRAMIAFAAAHFDPARHSNLAFAVADARALPFRGRFDLAVSFNALHWVPDQAAALRSLRAALESGGRAQLRLVTAGERKSLESIVEETRESERWRGHFANFSDPYLRLTPAEYAALAESAGLRVLGAATALKTWDFGSRAAFFDFCAVGLVAWTERLPAEDRAGFIGEALDRYAALAGSRANAASTFHFYQSDFTLGRE
ncbi:MAG TPA: methyltransferase domain-containing protein [Gammaproteobacteria bacterium]|nr:methyltransferase domain-containing protein [Gammaproteobacteria bacterium]